jgi:hypothetical protein
MSKEVMLTNVRGAFLDKLFKAKAFKGGDGEPRYSGCFFVEPKSENAKKLDAAILAVATEMWDKKAPQILATLKGDKKKYFYFEGTLSNDEGDAYEGAEGFYAVNAGQPESKGAPLVIDNAGVKDQNLTVKDGRAYTPANAQGVQFPILTAKDGRPYSGCYVNVKLNVWAQDNSYGKAIRAAIQTVQFRAHGDSFGGGAPATADGFEDMSEGADAGDLA